MKPPHFDSFVVDGVRYRDVQVELPGGGTLTVGSTLSASVELGYMGPVLVRIEHGGDVIGEDGRYRMPLEAMVATDEDGPFFDENGREYVLMDGRRNYKWKPGDAPV